MGQTLLARCSYHGGTVIGVLGRHFGLWSLNACRIVYVIEEEASLLRRYGFAFARPAHPLARAGPPFVHVVQRQFAAASLRAMAAAVNA
jgi:uncharacterized protein (UPF0548 family)